MSKKELISDYKAFRKKLGLNQTDFWSPLGVTQSAGSRYESKRDVPPAVSILAHAVHVEGRSDMGVDHYNFSEGGSKWRLSTK